MRRALAAIGLVLVFLLASVFGLLLHLDTPPARRIALSKVNALLSSTFRGSVRIEELSSTSLLRGEIAGASVTVHDPDGHEVLEVHGASAEVDLWALASSWRSSGPIRVHLPTASVAEAEFTVSDTDGRIGIARAFDTSSRFSRALARSARSTFACNIPGIT